LTGRSFAGRLSMQIEYKFDNDLNCLLMRFTGELTPKPINDLIAAIKNMPGLGSGHLRLTDVRQATAPEATAQVY
jgi:hypothetical protein